MALFLLGIDRKAALTLLALNTFRKNIFYIFLRINIVLTQKIESKETPKVFKTFDFLFMSMKSFKKYPKNIVFKKSSEPIQNWSQNIVQPFHFFSAEHSCGFEQIQFLF